MASRKRSSEVQVLLPPPLTAFLDPTAIAASAPSIATIRMQETFTEERRDISAFEGQSRSYLAGIDRRLNVTVPEEVVRQYATNMGSLEALITETAYAQYAQGSGDVLGACTVLHTEAGVYNLQYQWLGSTNQTYFGGNPIVTYGSGPDSSTVLTNWLPGNWETEYAPTLQADFYRQQIMGAWTDAPIDPARAARVEVINKKAAALLLQHLSESQRKTWLAESYFVMQAPSGRRYRLQKGHFHNVFLLDSTGKKVREYCAYAKDPGGMLPVEDNLFAQLMTLRFNEQEFLAKANTWNLIGARAFAGQGVDAGVPQEAQWIAA